MCFFISSYLAKHSNWIATVLRRWVDAVVLIESDEVSFSIVNGSLRCTVDLNHMLSCDDLRRISTVLGDRYWAICPSSGHQAMSLYFYVKEDEL